MQSKFFIRLSHFLTISFLSMVLLGCFGDGDGQDKILGLPRPAIGVALQAEIHNARYVTSEGETGFTDEGKFPYFSGDTVEFFVGDILLGIPGVTVRGAPLVTPYEMAGCVGPLELCEAAVNISVFLQTINENAPSTTDGIIISDATQTALAGSSLDFTSPTFSDDLENLIAVDLPGTTIITDEEALDNFCRNSYLPNGGEDTFGYPLEGCEIGPDEELLTNGDFEEPDADGGDVGCEGLLGPGWECFNTPFINSNNFDSGQQGPLAHSPDQTVKMFGPFLQDAGTGIFQDVPAIGRQTYTATAWAQNWTGGVDSALNNLAILQVAYLDGDGAVFRAIEVVADSTDDGINTYLPPNDWVELSITADAPAGTFGIRVQLLHVQINCSDPDPFCPPEAGGSVFWDDASLVGPAGLPPPPPPPPFEIPEGFELTFSDEFNEDVYGPDPVTVDPAKWFIETGYGEPRTDPGWGNDEWQEYTTSLDNVRVEDGNLVIDALCVPQVGGVAAGGVATGGVTLLAAGDNLLANGTFETPDATGGDVPNPPGWDVTFQSFTNANDGPNSGPVSHDDGGSNQSVKMFGDGGRIEQTVPVTVGLSTTLTAYAMNWSGDSLADNGQALLALTFCSDLVCAPGEEISTTELFFQAPAQLPQQDGAEVGDWAQMSITEIAPAGTMSARARLQIVPDGGGALFWDDASLTQEIDEPPAGDNLLANSNFETPDATGGDVPNPPGWDVTFQSFTNANDGPNSGPVSHDDGGSNQSAKMFGDGGRLEQTVPVTVGLSTTLTAYAMNWSGDSLADNGQALLALTFCSDLVCAPGEEISTTELFFQAPAQLPQQDGAEVGDWAQMSITEVAPAGTMSARARLQIVPDGGGALFWDDASLTQEIDEPPAGDNLLANTTFETPDATGGDVPNPPGWDVTFQSFTNANDGPNSGPVSHDDGGSNQSAKMFGDGGRLEQTVPVTVGLSTTLTAYAMNWSGDSLADNGQALLALTFCSDLVCAPGEEISTTELFFQAPAQLPQQDGAEVGDWAQMSITEVAPAGTMSARARLQIVPDGGGALFWDDVSLTQETGEPSEGCDAGIRNDPTKPDKITSGRINTQDLFEFQYGIVRARINTPGGLAVWPAFWMLGFDFPETPWPVAGEIDIMEQFQKSSSPLFTHSTLHFCDDNVVPAGQECNFDTGYIATDTTPIGNSLLFDGPAGQDWSSDFHIYQLEWTEDRIITKVDDVVVFNAPINPTNMEEFNTKPFYLILNIAMGGNLGPGGALPPSGNETYPQTMLVDWVRVYQEAP